MKLASYKLRGRESCGVVSAGTPIKNGPRSHSPAWHKPYDVVEIEVPQIGVLRSTVVAEA